MDTALDANTSSRDLLEGIPLRHVGPSAGNRSNAPELVAARALCRQLRRRQARPEKQRIAHLICMNLVSMLKRGSKR
jgi:hypothetical protein